MATAPCKYPSLKDLAPGPDPRFPAPGPDPRSLYPPVTSSYCLQVGLHLDAKHKLTHYNHQDDITTSGSQLLHNEIAAT